MAIVESARLFHKSKVWIGKKTLISRKRFYRSVSTAMLFLPKTLNSSESKVELSFETKCYRKLDCLTSEFHVKFHAKNRYRTNREVMSTISVLSVRYQTFIFCKFVHFQGIFTIATIFSRNSRQQYSFMHKCNSTLNTLSLIANQNAGLL